MPAHTNQNSLFIRYNYVLFLFGLLIVLLGGSGSLYIFRGGTPLLLDLIAVAVFVFGIWSLAENRALYLTGWTLLVLVIVLNAAGVLFGLQALRYAMLLVLTCFLVLTVVVATKHILIAGEVDLNRLFGAACVYILLGLIFGNVYFFIFAAHPDAFTGLSAKGFNGQLVELTYHSFVTLTTLGYGDINPILPLARTLCYLEAVIGQMYLTILVAALVGIHIASRQDKKTEP